MVRRGLQEVVEDEFFIAVDIEAALTQEGAEVVGPFSVLEEALAAAETEALSLAVLDIRLAGTNTQRVCDVLDDRGIPFFFHSGQPLPESMAVKYGQIPFIDKPARMSELVDAARLLNQATPANGGKRRQSR